METGFRPLRSLLISDVHANLHALNEVLTNDWEVDEIWCLGDIVGYGAEPVACIESLTTRDLRLRRVAGNHDLAAAGELALTGFVPDGRRAIRWTVPLLAEPERRWLKRDAWLELRQHSVTLVHGSPVGPVWTYINSIEAAEAAFAQLNTRLGLFGHTHVPIIYFLDSSGRLDVFRPRAGQRIDLGVLGGNCLLNPGSVGQPRDGDPRASCAVLDLDAGWVEFHRIEYPVRGAQDAIRAAGLPSALADRLACGA